jgi:signal transduction histidine kinase
MNDNGTVKIGATQGSSTVQIMIVDSGVDMAQDQVGKLFNEEQLVTTPGTNNEKGSGIGLWVTKELLISNNGHIDVVSSPEKGTTFTIALPTKRPGS